ncbi:MAG: helix-turn-helix domain-containing protein [Chloroflexia bacterium]|nr:helix-turn-helix domain-containing protein [Chloroflexia bacterium]
MRGCILPKSALVVAYPRTFCPNSSAGSDRPPATSRRKLDGHRQRTILTMREKGRTLREIAAEVGVSHETVRLVLRAQEHHRAVPLTSSNGRDRRARVVRCMGGTG